MAPFVPPAVVCVAPTGGGARGGSQRRRPSTTESRVSGLRERAALSTLSPLSVPPWVSVSGGRVDRAYQATRRYGSSLGQDQGRGSIGRALGLPGGYQVWRTPREVPAPQGSELAGGER